MVTIPSNARHPASFRDPCGFVFRRDGRVYRQVNRVFAEHYDRLLSCGLYDALTERRMLVAHDEVDDERCDAADAYRVLRPEPVPMISYPYEWCFGQLKAAALLTLDVAARALDHGMTLKDCSAYNVQFVGGRPVFIDTLSFETLAPGEPWAGYRQFCQHFLAPLALMSRVDVRLGQMMRVHLDGVPLDLASKMLPRRTWLRPGLAMHIHLHARAQRALADAAGRSATPAKPRRVSPLAVRGLIASLRSAVRKLDWRPAGTEWGDYYEHTNYTDDAHHAKASLVAAMLDAIRPATVWDLGANTGVFSRLASERGAYTACFDVDPAAVELNYRRCRDEKSANLLPLVLDLTNPSPGIGWGGEERSSLLARGPADAVIALAVVHHLAISNHVPLPRVADFLAGAGRSLIIEFVPKDDSQVRRLLATRRDIFGDYHRAGFEAAFARRFAIEAVEPIPGSLRTLYRMRRRSTDGDRP